MTEYSTKKQNVFEGRLVDILNRGAVNLALGIGYRLGLFHCLAEMDQPKTVEQIAESAGLHSRYVKEWLGIMAAGGIVELTVEPDSGPMYYLPPEHGAVLTGLGGGTNLGVYTQEIPLLTSLALDAVLNGFGTGEGVPYSNYPSFQAFMSELSIAKHQKLLMECFVPSVDSGRLVERLKQGIRVMDLGCGEGTAVLLMAEAFPKSEFVGLDCDDNAVATARQSAEKMSLKNISFWQSDAAALKDDPGLAGSFDYITAFDAIHDQTAPDRALAGIHHALAPDGLFSMVDIAAESDHQGNMDHPMAPFLYTVSLMHCMPVGLCDGGCGLGMMWGRQKAMTMLREAGFDQVEIVDMSFDPFNDHYLCRKS